MSDPDVVRSLHFHVVNKDGVKKHAVKMAVQAGQLQVLIMKHVYPPLCVQVVTHTGVCLSSLASSDSDLIIILADCLLRLEETSNIITASVLRYFLSELWPIVGNALG